MTDGEREKLMADYRAAYMAANGKPVLILYRNGWYTIGKVHGGMKARAADVVRLTENLKERSEARK